MSVLPKVSFESSQTSVLCDKKQTINDDIHKSMFDTAHNLKKQETNNTNDKLNRSPSSLIDDLIELMQQMSSYVTLNNFPPNRKKIFAVFVCGPDPTQCVENPNAPNQRGVTYINLLKNESNSANEEWKQYMIYRNEFPSKSEIETFSAIIITGSKHDAYTDDVEWKSKLCAIIKAIYHSKECRTKILGVCFGHQIIMHALRERGDDRVVGRNTKKNKMELGLISLDLTDQFDAFWSRFDIQINMKNKAQKLRIHQAHQDVVYSVPSYLEDAAIMAYSPHTDIEMYHIGDRIIGVQGHPEFTTEYLVNAIHKNGEYFSKLYTQREMKLILSELEQSEADREQWEHLFGTWIRR